MLSPSRYLAVLLAVLCAAHFCRADALSVAKEALRDGLWGIARLNAKKAPDPEAFVIVLEAYAREGKWAELLKELDAHKDAKGDAPYYYRALALAKTLSPEDALKELEIPHHSFESSEFAEKWVILKADLRFLAGDAAGAAKIVEANSLFSRDDESKMVSARIFNAVGMGERARALWREVASSTNASISVFVAAARNLGETDVLRAAYEKAQASDLRRVVGLDLGRKLLGGPETFAEGEKLIRAIANDSPDAEGAMDSFVVLADAYLEREEYSKSADAYQKAIEAWPSLARNAAVQEGFAWALLKLGRTTEALMAFSRAEELSATDAAKAEALVKQGDVLSSLSRGIEAMEKYRKALDLYPDTPACRKLKTLVELMDLESKGRELYGEFRFEEALKTFAEISGRDSARKARMDYLQMLCLYGLGRDAEAVLKAKNLAAGCTDQKIRAEATLWLAKFFYNARQWQDSCDLFSAYATNMMPSSAQAPSALLWASRAAFALSDFKGAIDLSTKLAVDYPESSERTQGCLLQGEALVALSRFDEAVVVLEKVAADSKTAADERFRAKMLMADAMFLLGADNSTRYVDALKDYMELQQVETLSERQKLLVSFKIARTLEKLGRMDEALDAYYSSVILGYRDFRLKGIQFDDEIKAIFARAAFRLSDEYESLGQDEKAKSILRLVIKSDVKTAADEARRKFERIKEKGAF